MKQTLLSVGDVLIMVLSAGPLAAQERCCPVEGQHGSGGASLQPYSETSTQGMQ